MIKKITYLFCCKICIWIWIVFIFFYVFSVCQRPMRDEPLPLLGENRWICLGGYAGNIDIRQDAETSERRLRQLRHQVRMLLILCMTKFVQSLWILNFDIDHCRKKCFWWIERITTNSIHKIYRDNWEGQLYYNLKGHFWQIFHKKL